MPQAVAAWIELGAKFYTAWTLHGLDLACSHADQMLAAYDTPPTGLFCTSHLSRRRDNPAR